MNKNLLCKVPSTLGLLVDVLLIVQLTVTLYQNFFKPKTVESSRDNNFKKDELWEESGHYYRLARYSIDDFQRHQETSWNYQEESKEDATVINKQIKQNGTSINNCSEPSNGEWATKQFETATSSHHDKPRRATRAVFYHSKLSTNHIREFGIRLYHPRIRKRQWGVYQS